MTREEFISNWDGSSADDRFDNFVDWLEEEKDQADIDFTLDFSRDSNGDVVPILDYDGDKHIEIIVANSLFDEQSPDLAVEAGEIAIDFIEDKYKEKKEKEEEEKAIAKDKKKREKLEKLMEKLDEALAKGEDLRELIEDSEFAGLDDFQDLLDDLDLAFLDAVLDEFEIDAFKDMLDDIKDKYKKLAEKYGSL